MNQFLNCWLVVLIMMMVMVIYDDDDDDYADDNDDNDCKVVSPNYWSVVLSRDDS